MLTTIAILYGILFFILLLSLQGRLLYLQQKTFDREHARVHMLSMWAKHHAWRASTEEEIEQWWRVTTAPTQTMQQFRAPPSRQTILQY